VQQAGATIIGQLSFDIYHFSFETTFAPNPNDKWEMSNDN